MGVTAETPAMRIFTDMRAFRIYDGPSEVHKLTLAKQLLRAHPTTPDLFPSQHIPSGAARAAEKYATHLRLPGHRRGWVPGEQA
jgi:acyl-CoA dehydrogenase